MLMYKVLSGLKEKALKGLNMITPGEARCFKKNIERPERP